MSRRFGHRGRSVWPASRGQNQRKPGAGPPANRGGAGGCVAEPVERLRDPGPRVGARIPGPQQDEARRLWRRALGVVWARPFCSCCRVSFEGSESKRPPRVAFWGNGPGTGYDIVAERSARSRRARRRARRLPPRQTSLSWAGRPTKRSSQRSSPHRMYDHWVITRRTPSRGPTPPAPIPEPTPIQTPPPSGPYPVSRVLPVECTRHPSLPSAGRGPPNSTRQGPRQSRSLGPAFRRAGASARCPPRRPCRGAGSFGCAFRTSAQPHAPAARTRRRGRLYRRGVTR